MPANTARGDFETRSASCTEASNPGFRDGIGRPHPWPPTTRTDPTGFVGATGHYVGEQAATVEVASAGSIIMSEQARGPAGRTEISRDRAGPAEPRTSRSGRMTVLRDVLVRCERRTALGRVRAGRSDPGLGRAAADDLRSGPTKPPRRTRTVWTTDRRLFPLREAVLRQCSRSTRGAAGDAVCLGTTAPGRLYVGLIGSSCRQTPFRDGGRSSGGRGPEARRRHRTTVAGPGRERPRAGVERLERRAMFYLWAGSRMICRRRRRQRGDRVELGDARGSRETS